MTDVDDSFRIEGIIAALEKQYAAQKITSWRIKPPCNGCQLAVNLNAFDQQKANAQSRNIEHSAKTTAQALGLDARVYAPEFGAGGVYFVPVEIFNPNGSSFEPASFPQPMPIPHFVSFPVTGKSSGDSNPTTIKAIDRCCYWD